jgi:hypothetical protein
MQVIIILCGYLFSMLGIIITQYTLRMNSCYKIAVKAVDPGEVFGRHANGIVEPKGSS